MKIIVLLLSLLITTFSKIELSQKSLPIYPFTNTYGNFTLTNFRTFQYYTQIKIGTPGINCTIIFDTTQPQFWLSTIWGNYQSTQSSSFNQSTNASNITYASGSVQGYSGTEKIALSQLAITNLTQQMIFVNKAVNISNTTDGLLGLANDANYQNWLEIAVTQGQLPDSKFAFDLRNQSIATYFYAGSTSFSSVQLTWIDLDQTSYWSIPIQSTIIDSYSQPQDYNAQSAVVDPGTSILVVGATGYTMLMTNNLIAQCKFDDQSGFYICSCNAAYPSITFVSSTMNFTAVSSDYMIKLQGGYCILGVQTNSLAQNYMTFGDSLMRNYFVAYDKTNNKIGFSSPKQQTIQESKGFLSK
eukprot:TRINITY_DN774_c0_g1_i2.p1 TRINITY_DN774_c0_g1~~TRINITY_DN774_c0_g1_i2.p1  ORF type:complete len:357 (+),score=42.77 TRINITY_DN774_c0_g1_i2:2-1072(+)